MWKADPDNEIRFPIPVQPEWARRSSPLRSRKCHLGDVFRLRPLGPISDFEFDLLTLNQCLVTIPGDRTIVHEYVLISGLFDKSVALGIVKPFDQSYCLGHFSCFLQQTTKNRKFVFVNFLLGIWQTSQANASQMTCNCVGTLAGNKGFLTNSKS